MISNFLGRHTAGGTLSNGRRSRGLALFAVVLLALSGAPCMAATLEEQMGTNADQVLGEAVRTQHSSFAMLLYVQDQHVAVERAWGVEDSVKRAPYSNATSLFDLNSLTKLFTAVAIAQLIDRGAISSIDDPVNKYLKHFHLPQSFGHEVTIREVVTHSEGFEDTELGPFALRWDTERYLAERFPGFFPNPGHYSTYGSYAALLLAHLVCEVSGLAYHQYLEENVLHPLGMLDTHFAATETPLQHRIIPFQPLAPGNFSPPVALAPLDKPQAFGQAVMSGNDMAKFMLALVGAPGTEKVFSPHARALLFQVLQTNGVGGSQHGLLFDSFESSGMRIYHHGGRNPGMNCRLAFDIEKSTSVFWCFGDVRTKFGGNPDAPPAENYVTSTLMLPLARRGAEPQSIDVPWSDDWLKYTGSYLSTVRHRTGISRIISLAHPTWVKVDRAGNTLRFDGVEGFVQIAPGVFGSPHILETYAFTQAPVTGRTMLSNSILPSVFDRPAWWEDPHKLPVLMLLCVLVAGTGLPFVVWKRYGGLPRFRWPVLLYGATLLAALVSVGVFHALGQAYLDGKTLPLNVIRACAFLTVPLSVWLLVNAYRTSFGPDSRLLPMGFARWHYLMLALSSVVLVCALLAAQLISFTPIT
jgi:CubicO group peptidase (beta-lactamase class C family)